MTAAAFFDALQRETFATATAATTSGYPPERRLAADVVVAVLSARKYATVASTRPDGRPHATPVSFVLVGTDLWLPTVGGAARTRNVLAQPYLVLVVSEGEGDAHLALILEGPATVETTAPPEAGSAPEWADAWLVLRPERLFTYAAEQWPGPAG